MKLKCVSRFSFIHLQERRQQSSVFTKRKRVRERRKEKNQKLEYKRNIGFLKYSSIITHTNVFCMTILYT